MPTILPTWDELCADLDRLPAAAELAERRYALKAKPPALRLKLARLMASALLRDDCSQQLIGAAWPDLVDLAADQVLRNRLVVKDEILLVPSPHETLLRWPAPRPHDVRLECTRATALRRVERAMGCIGTSKPILLLNDQDQVSIELALAGFSDVTVVADDLDLLERLERAARACEVEVQLHHEATTPLPPATRRVYDLVLLNPKPRLSDVRRLLDTALELTGARPGVAFLVGVALLALRRDGLAQLSHLLDERGLQVLEVQQGFNAYPMPQRLYRLIHRLNQIVIGFRTLATEGHALPFFLSDAIVLRKL